jgi:hypothetical protein
MTRLHKLLYDLPAHPLAIVPNFEQLSLNLVLIGIVCRADSSVNDGFLDFFHFKSPLFYLTIFQKEFFKSPIQPSSAPHFSFQHFALKFLVGKV